MSRDYPPKIHPIESGSIINQKVPWYLIWYHFQSIAQAGKYTVLSTPKNNKALIFASGEGNQKKAVAIEPLPAGFEHAGGIGVLKISDEGWIIAVPVWVKSSNNEGAILHYFLPQKGGIESMECVGITEVSGTRVYAVGITQYQDSVLIAAVIDDKGKKIAFLTSKDSSGDRGYRQLGDVWNAQTAIKGGWSPDRNWGPYPNSISLINCGHKIYLVGMRNGWAGFGKDSADIYDVNLEGNASNRRLTKKQHFHAHCNEPSFRWGASTSIHSGLVEILTVERNFKNRVRYDRFRLDFDCESHSSPLRPHEIPIDRVDISD